MGPEIIDSEKVPIKIWLLQPSQFFERFFIGHSIPCRIQLGIPELEPVEFELKARKG